MAAAVTLLLIGCLLQGSVHGQYEVTVPPNIEVLSGSCVTIPCSFTIEKKLEWDLDKICKALWYTVQNTLVFDSSIPQQRNEIKGELIGDLTKKDCTTRLDNLQPGHSNKYYFRLECYKVRYSYSNRNFQTDISVKADPPRPTLTPSTVLVSEGTQVRLTCSAPAPCQSNPPNLTWTSSLGDSKEKLQENQDKTKVKSVLTFTAHRLHHTKEIACTAVYNKQDGSIESSVSLKANVTFAPEILPSFVCTKATDQLNCSCETVGNPFPTLQWYLDEQPVNQSDGFTVSNEPFNDTGLRSIITLDQPQRRNISTLVCHSSNSLGSASGRFYVYRLEPPTCALNQDLSMSTVFIATVVALVCVILVILVCALLLIIRAQKTHNSLPTGVVTMSQLITSEEGNEEPNTTEEDIYVNMQRQANVVHPAAISEANSTILPNSWPNNAEGAVKSSEEEGGSDVVYSAVKWKSKSKKMNGKSSKRKDLEEERHSYRNFVDNAVEMGNIYDEVRNSNMEGEGLYSQVKFKTKNALHE